MINLNKVTKKIKYKFTKKFFLKIMSLTCRKYYIFYKNENSLTIIIT